MDKVVVNIDGSMTLGPGGFNSYFYKFWRLMRFFYHCFHNGVTPKSMMSFSVALISNVESPLESGDFRPISFLGSLYKLMAKVLATRLSKVMGSLFPLNSQLLLREGTWWMEWLSLNEVLVIAKMSKWLSPVENILTINVVLKSFELASALKLNFAKIFMFGVNVRRSFLDLAKTFLHYNVGSLSFKYLGFPVDESLKKKKTRLYIYCSSTSI
ncbi:uncharacterized protein LOC131598194 [Vicia villosa]|uniref:uncharacterized protein LOC131598194 n=1 Tax=Vicia villosa TaxID=3911 RepID=UPI00273CB578|nr:uncharacterized protein LOC131598194 [Vicia villosa]